VNTCTVLVKNYLEKRYDKGSFYPQYYTPNELKEYYKDCIPIMIVGSHWAHLIEANLDTIDWKAIIHFFCNREKYQQWRQ